MSNVPDNLKYKKTHEWVQPLDDGTLRVGITDHAQDLLGDMVYVELPEVGQTFQTGEECGVVESVKAASDLYCPVAGEIVEVNEALAQNPEAPNKDPYGDGWIMRIKPDDADEVSTLMDAQAYRDMIASDSD
ncbi:MAG TPA: glycine cleavage system protein GcvH [Gammaproteobacteria bacterium]|nr:glycine cleavage system protein GcvH [Gammaproteobacteria bacterium]